MMLAALELTLFLLVPYLTGSIFLKCVLKGVRLPRLFYGSLSLLFGWCLVAIVLYVVYLTPVSRNLMNGQIILILLTVSGVLFVIAKVLPPAKDLNLFEKSFENDSQPAPVPQMIMVFAFALIAMQIYSIVVRATTVPIYAWDSVFHIAIKTKMIYYTGSLTSIVHAPNASYPLLNQFIQLWGAISFHEWNDLNAKWHLPVWLLCYLVIQYYFIKYFINWKWSVMGILFLISAPLVFVHANIAYNEFLIMVLYGTAFMMIVFWDHFERSGFLSLAGLASACTLLLKSEAVAYIFFLLLLLGILSFRKSMTMGDRIKNIVTFLAPAAGSFVLLYVFRHVLDLPFDHRTSLKISSHIFLDAGYVLLNFLMNVVFSGNWGIVGIMLLASLALKPKVFKESKIACWILLIVALHICFLVGLGVATNHRVFIIGKRNVEVFSRLLLHIYPLAVILLTICLSRIKQTTLRVPR